MSRSRKPIKGFSALGKALQEQHRDGPSNAVAQSSAIQATKSPAAVAAQAARPSTSAAAKAQRPKSNASARPLKFEIMAERPNEVAASRMKGSAKRAAEGPTRPEDLKGEAALRHVISEIKDVLFAISEARPREVSQATADLVASRVAVGAGLLRKRPAPDPNGFIVGVDFGTSSTKVVIHQPFTAGDPSAALPVPLKLRSRNVDHLWQTAVWYDADARRFSLVPSEGAQLIDGFKAGLLQGEGGQADVAGIPRSVAACAYLALLFAYVLGYYEQERPLGSVAADHFSAFHVGVPVAAQDDTRIRPEFLRIAQSALSLAKHAERLTLADVQSASGTEAGVKLFTELEGVVAGYQATRDYRPGAHMVVDVGASTLDVATFRLFERDGEPRSDVYAAGVEMLGSEALEWARAAGVPGACFRSACAHHAWSQFHDTRTKKDRSFDRARSDQPVTFLLVGGGRSTDLHKELFEFPGKDDYLKAPRQTPQPANCHTSSADADFARLLVAYGLSRDPSEFPTFRLPSEVEDEPERSVRDVTDGFISKEQV